MSIATKDQLLTPDIGGSNVMTVKTGRHTCDVKTRTESGAAWVRKYLHPPMPLPNAYCGIPDYNNSPSATPEYRAVQNIATSIATGSEILYFTSHLMLVMPSVVTPVATWSFNSADVAPTPNPLGLVVNPNINVNNLSNDYSSWRMAYKSVTTDLNATAFTNQGVVTSALFRPNVFRGSLASAFNVYGPSEQFVSSVCRHFFGSEHKMSSVKDGVKKLADGDLLATTVQIVDLGKIPLNSTQVEMLGPNAVSTKATEGAYMVTPFSQPVTEYKSTAPGDFKTSESAFVGYPCLNFFSEIRPDGTYNVSPFIQTSTGVIPGTTTPNVPDLPWADMMWGWILYEGLSVSAATAASNPPPYITVKAITGAEYQPKPGSNVAPYTHESAMPDRDALDMAAMCAYGRMDALPSRENFLGSLFPLILSAAPKVISALVSAFGTKKEDGRVKELEGTVNKLAQSVEKTKLAPMTTAVFQAAKTVRRRNKRAVKVGKRA